MAKQLIDVYMSLIENYLYNRRRFDTLALKAVLALPGAVSYIERRLFLPITGDIDQLFDNYPYQHLTIDADQYWPDARQYELSYINNSVHFDITVVNYKLLVEAGVRGHHELLWRLYDEHDDKPPILKALIFCTAYQGQAPSPRMTQAVHDLQLSSMEFNVMGFLGALCAGHIQSLDGYAEAIPILKPDIFKHVNDLNVFLDHFNSNLKTIIHVYNRPNFFSALYVKGLLARAFVQKANLRILTWLERHNILRLDAGLLQSNLAYFRIYERKFGRESVKPHINSLLVAAIRRNDRTAILYTIEHGFDDWESGMDKAAECGNLELVQFFEARGVISYDEAMYYGQAYPRIRNYLASKGVSLPDSPIEWEY